MEVKFKRYWNTSNPEPKTWEPGQVMECDSKQAKVLEKLGYVEILKEAKPATPKKRTYKKKVISPEETK